MSARDLTGYGNRHAVLVRIDWVAMFLLFLTHNELADDIRTTVAMVARQNVRMHARESSFHGKTRFDTFFTLS